MIFGASGDLTKRKLAPALYNLALDGFFVSPSSIVGVARRPLPDDAFRAQILEGLNEFSRRRPIDDAAWGRLAANLHYVTADFKNPEEFAKLRADLEAIEKRNNTPTNRLFYLAIPPSPSRPSRRILPSAASSASTSPPGRA